MADGEFGNNHLELAADIVSAYVSKNPVPASSLPDLIQTVHASLGNLGRGAASPMPVEEPRAPAVSIRKSVTPDFIVCLEDGKKFKSLKRHLQTSYNMSPADYRAKWNLPSDYPMTAPAYSASRSELAKKLGLGRKPAPVPEPVVRKRGRPKKVV